MIGIGLVGVTGLAACGGGGGGGSGSPHLSCDITMSGAVSDNWQCVALVGFTDGKLKVGIDASPIAYLDVELVLRTDAMFEPIAYDPTNIPDAALQLAPDHPEGTDQPVWETTHSAGAANDTGTFRLEVDDVGSVTMQDGDPYWLYMTGRFTATLEARTTTPATGEAFAMIEFASDL
jgi:hypothetical protein